MVYIHVSDDRNTCEKDNDIMNKNNVQESFEGLVKHFQIFIQDDET